MPFPKISATLNNCPLYSVTPELQAQIMQFAENLGYDNGHNPEYEYLKKVFADYYGFDPANFSWIDFASILKRYNPYDIQLIFGPVLRLFMKKFIAEDENTPFIAVADGVSVEGFIAKYTEIDPINARYFSLSPDELAMFVCKPLGFNLNYVRMDINQNIPVFLPCAEITLYHFGGIEGAGAGGHWERVEFAGDSIDYKAQPNTQLKNIEPLLGNDLEVNSFGLNLIKTHVRLTAQSITEQLALTDKFSAINLSALQIARYKLAISLVRKSLAEKILGPHITEATQEFIAHYVSELPKDKIIEDYLLTLGDNISVDTEQRRARLPSANYRKLVSQLTGPLESLAFSNKDQSSYIWLLLTGSVLGEVAKGIALVSCCAVMIAIIKLSLAIGVGLGLTTASLGAYRFFNTQTPSEPLENDLSRDIVL